MVERDQDVPVRASSEPSFESGRRTARSRTIRFAAALAFAAVAWRLVFVLAVIPRWEEANNLAPFPDRYPDLALSLLRARTLSHEGSPLAPTTVRGPGFPLWLLPGIVLGGESESPLWIGFWSGLPGILAGVLLAVRARRSLGTGPALICALCALFHPLVCTSTARAMADEFFAATGVLSTWLVLAALDAVESPDGMEGWASRGTDRPGMDQRGTDQPGTDQDDAPRSRDGRPFRPSRRALALGLGGAALLAIHLVTRANGILTVLSIGAGAIAAAIAGRSAGPWVRSARPRAFLLAGILGIALIPALAWSVRTSRLEGRPVYVHSLAAYNFWLHQIFEDQGYALPPSIEAKEALLREAGFDPALAPRFHWASLPPREVARLEQGLTRAAIGLIARRPMTVLARTLIGIPRFWFQASSARTSAAYLVLVFPFLVLAAIGAWRFGRGGVQRDPLAAALLATLILHNVAYAFLIPLARYSVEVYPALAFFAAMGWLALGRGAVRTR